MFASRIRVAVIATLSAVVIGATPTNAATRTHSQLGNHVTASGLDETTIRVVNRHASDVHVYAVTENGHRRLLGMVRAVSTTEFDIPSSLFEGDKQFQIKIYPVGSQGRFKYIPPEAAGVKTPALAVTAGDRIQLVVASTLSESTVAVVQS